MFLGISISDTEKSVKLKQLHVVVRMLWFLAMDICNLASCLIRPGTDLLLALKDYLLVKSY